MSRHNPEVTGPLDNPHVDIILNQGTTAPNCQPHHTQSELEREADDQESESLSEDDSSTYSQTSNSDNKPHSVTSSSKSDHLDASSKKEGGKTTTTSAHIKKKRDPSQEDPKKMGYIQMAKMGYQELVNAIIRPPRAVYKEEALGPPAFYFCSKRFTRTDFALKTKRGLNLQCSHWEPVERSSDRIPVVIYMHGNSSARVEVLPQLSYLLSLGLAVFAFDFAGSGKSDGEYVSLGYYEREDLMVRHLYGNVWMHVELHRLDMIHSAY